MKHVALVGRICFWTLAHLRNFDDRSKFGISEQKKPDSERIVICDKLRLDSLGFWQRIGNEWELKC